MALDDGGNIADRNGTLPQMVKWNRGEQVVASAETKAPAKGQSIL